MKLSLAIIALLALTSNASLIPAHFFGKGDSQDSKSTDDDHRPHFGGKFTNTSSIPAGFIASQTNGVHDFNSSTPITSFHKVNPTPFIEGDEVNTTITKYVTIQRSLAPASTSINIEKSDFGSTTLLTKASKPASTLRPENATAKRSVSGQQTRSGRGTYYTPSNGACEIYATESDYVVAIAQSLYESLGSNSEDVSSACGKYITASYNGKSVKVKVVDACESCADGDLDFSPAAFKQLADLDVGVIQIKWSFD